MNSGLLLLAPLVALCLAAPAWGQINLGGDQLAANDSIGGPSYGPLTFNVANGADFYIAQNGKFVPARLVDGVIEFHLKPAPFEIGYNGEQANICLATNPFNEISPDPSGNEGSCLAGPMSAALEPNTNELVVYSGKNWSDGNTELSDRTLKRADGMSGYEFSYQIDKLFFVASPDMSLDHFRGSLFGYIVVYKQEGRQKNEIMPIRLIFP